MLNRSIFPVFLRALGLCALILPVSTTISFAAANAPVVASSAARTVLDFDGDRRFSKGDFVTAMLPAFNDAAWRLVNLPHDWSSEGPFSVEYASGNGYAPGGVGWYRKHFKLDAGDTNKLVAVEFDGVRCKYYLAINI